jgi:hypothetical protein
MEPSFILSTILGLASLAGGTFAWSHKRHSELDRRIDQVEMTIHKEFVRKDELMPMMDRIDQRIQHIDEKLDRILLNDRRISS